MLAALDVSAVMPPEPVLVLDQCYHGVHPSRVRQCLQPTVERVLNVPEPVAAFHGVTARADRARDLLELHPGDTSPGWQVVRRSGHLAWLRQPAGYLSCFFFKHFKILSTFLIYVFFKYL